MPRDSFAKKIARMAKPKSVGHALSSLHIRKLSVEGLVHPEAVSPKGVHELCEAIVSRNDEDDATTLAFQRPESTDPLD